ncbi:hypothetical protein U9M48_005825 [Paspalum notatum var. saurae]|uniref:Uncharacterized protein n=1 Tax=Paspalum notatum var. saurae TaxID=547442 RepID=A0AAQ3PN66_PASNO
MWAPTRSWARASGRPVSPSAPLGSGVSGLGTAASASLGGLSVAAALLSGRTAPPSASHRRRALLRSRRSALGLPATAALHPWRRRHRRGGAPLRPLRFRAHACLLLLLCLRWLQVLFYIEELWPLMDYMLLL